MMLNESLLSQNLVYSSPRIFERRRRILEEARQLVSECGYEGFGIRELCLRAQVAPQTVYKAFGNKERLVTLAIRQHFESFAEHQKFFFPRTTLNGVIERIIVSDAGTRASREYVAALVA
ncbi:MAG: TetR/AcrR family transcriptional regulator, partial [Rhizorhabdus sp.]|uniref:TetR/AcrR family transcriptional regulator n=1 Tax=Rhizorhabdus sp. TaxID=1968843 RepID=UPI001B48EF22